VTKGIIWADWKVKIVVAIKATLVEVCSTGYRSLWMVEDIFYDSFLYRILESCI